jgi:hypothetical protein
VEILGIASHTHNRDVILTNLPLRVELDDDDTSSVAQAGSVVEVAAVVWNTVRDTDSPPCASICALSSFLHSMLLT